MTFLTEPEPRRGIALDVLPGIRRVVARNPSVMTYHGTNTYLIERDDGLTIIDPGPDDAEHVADVLRAAGPMPITRLVLTHAHSDHHGATQAMQAATGAPAWGCAIGAPAKFVADHRLEDGGAVAGLRAIFTPGHAPDHLSFAYDVPGTGQVLFSGDHVMGWSSSIVNPPDGNMRDYYRSLELLLERPDVLYLPAHGPVEPNPHALVEQLLKHRRSREGSILNALRAGPRTVRDIAADLYAKTDIKLQFAAERNVLAHLLKLREEAFVVEFGATAADSPTERSAVDLESEPTPETRSEFWKITQRDAMRQFAKAA
jgi:glyoxylase-like metal-dependent hydrolase (beta-lactamase superfamily II)